MQKQQQRNNKEQQQEYVVFEKRKTERKTKPNQVNDDTAPNKSKSNKTTK